MVERAHQTQLSADDDKLLPATISCIANGDTFTVPVKGKARADASKTTLIVDNSDGDQISGIFAFVSDLQDLAAGKVQSVTLKTFGGYWWADGDHYSFDAAAVTCSLK